MIDKDLPLLKLNLFFRDQIGKIGYGESILNNYEIIVFKITDKFLNGDFVDCNIYDKRDLINKEYDIYIGGSEQTFRLMKFNTIQVFKDQQFARRLY